MLTGAEVIDGILLEDPEWKKRKEEMSLSQKRIKTAKQQLFDELSRDFKEDRWLHNNEYEDIEARRVSRGKYEFQCIPGELASDADVNRIPEEILVTPYGQYKEGMSIQIFVNRYERNKKARDECIRNHGTACAACGEKMSEKYGKKLNGYIHVHHKIPISTIGAEYVIDPQNDLSPICPNCHAVVHLFDPPLSIDDVKILIEDAKRRKAD